MQSWLFKVINSLDKSLTGFPIVMITSHMLVECVVGRTINFLKLTEDTGLFRTCHHPSLKGSRIFSEADGNTRTIKATWSVRGFLFLLQNHVIRYKLYLL